MANEVASGYPLLTTQYTLVPLPLHKRRLHWRGFNQAEILCQAISAELDLPILDALVRVKSTKTQKDLKRDQRIKNIKDAFALSPSPLLFKVGWHPKGDGVVGETFSIKDKNLILIDDVTTTGATLQEAAQILKRSGAAKVICLTVARD